MVRFTAKGRMVAQIIVDGEPIADDSYIGTWLDGFEWYAYSPAVAMAVIEERNRVDGFEFELMEIHQIELADIPPDGQVYLVAGYGQLANMIPAWAEAQANRA